MTTPETQEQFESRQEAPVQYAFGNEQTGPAVYGGQYLSAEEVSRLAGLMQELRELTQSRRTFAAANKLLARLTLEPQPSHALPQDQSDFY